MQFEIKNVTRSLHDVTRAIGYRPSFFQKEGEVSIVRQIGRNDYPRFHLYIKTNLSDKTTLIFNLHLDQKRPSYEGQTGHSGEYDGEMVEGEIERIKQLLT